MQLPGPVRAVIGLAANVADEARHLPDRAIELPMLAVSSVLQLSLRAQQRYAMLTARGDEVLGGQPTDEPPAWATFDDDLPDPPAAPPASAADAARDATAILDEIFGSLGGSREDTDDGELTPPTPITAAKKSPKKPSQKSSATKSAAKKQPGSTSAGKRISKPRHTAPSKFDDVDD